MGLGKLESCVFIDENDGGLSANRNIDLMLYKLYNKELLNIGHIFEDVADNASVDLYISSDVALHFILNMNPDNTCYIRIYRDPIIADDGTELPSINKFQDANPVQSVNSGVFYTPTVTNVGDLLYESIATRGWGRPEALGSREAAWTLDGSCSMLIRATNVSGAAIPLSINLSGHE